jgi:hypothetical protein
LDVNRGKKHPKISSDTDFGNFRVRRKAVLDAGFTEIFTIVMDRQANCHACEFRLKIAENRANCGDSPGSAKLNALLSGTGAVESA